jgi:hypothetical protein
MEVNQKCDTMKKLIYNAFIICLLFACTDHNNPSRLSNTCSVDNPAEDLPWLKQKISEMEASPNTTTKFASVLMGTYDGETVFIFDNCCPFCDMMIFVYNCDGQIMDNVDSGMVTKPKIIWKPADFACNQ